VPFAVPFEGAFSAALAVPLVGAFNAALAVPLLGAFKAALAVPLVKALAVFFAADFGATALMSPLGVLAMIAFVTAVRYAIKDFFSTVLPPLNFLPQMLGLSSAVGIPMHFTEGESRDICFYGGFPR